MLFLVSLQVDGADEVLGTVTDFSKRPVGVLPPLSAWFWTEEQKRDAANYSRVEVTQDGATGARYLKVTINNSLPWTQQGKAVESYRLHDTGLSILSPRSDVLRVRARVLSGRVVLGLSCSTIYFGNSDVYCQPRTLVADQAAGWQTIDFSLNEGLTRNYRRAGFTQDLPVIALSRWIQESLTLDVMRGSAGTLLIDKVELVSKGQGYRMPAFPDRDIRRVALINDFESPTAMAQAFTFTHAPTDLSGAPVLARKEWAPPILSRAQVGMNGTYSLESRAVGHEEVAFTGVKTPARAGANAILLRIRAEHSEAIPMMSVDFVVYATPTGAAASFPWTAYEPPAAWKSHPDTAFTYYLAQERIGNVSYGMYHARRLLQHGIWQSLVIPMKDFMCLYGQKDCLSWCQQQVDLRSERVVALGFLSSFRQHIGETRIWVDEVSWVSVPETSQPLRSFWQPPVPPSTPSP